MRKVKAWFSPNLGLGLDLIRGRGLGDACLSVYVSSSVVATVLVDPSASAMVTLKADPIDSLDRVKETLRAQLRVLKTPRVAANLVLAQELYATQLVERPNVEPSELLEAVRWRLQDHVEFDIETAALDTFELPQGAARQAGLVFPVALPKSLLASVVGDVTSAGLEIGSVDVAELALRNIVWRRFPGADQSIAMLCITANRGMINISRGEDLYLTRRLSGMPEEFNDSAWRDFREKLLLQVQRSLDYYQSAMAQPECDLLLVACTDDWTERVTDYLAENLPMPVRRVSESLTDEFPMTLFNPTEVELDCNHLTVEQANALAAALPALGGAFRSRIESLEAAA